MRKTALCTALLVLLVSPALAGIVVSFDLPVTVVPAPGPVVTVDLVANIPGPDAIIGWGLDLSVAGVSAVYVPPPAINLALFTPVFAPDLDDLAGLVPPPGVVFGPHVVLATLTFNTVAQGDTWLTASYTAGDLAEGFIGQDGWILDVTFEDGLIRVLPEPASLGMLALLALIRRR